MNAIRKINELNQKELTSGVSQSASWHADYKDSSYIYIGYIPNHLKEIDIIRIFSQYGIPTHINLIKDKETGKSRGFCYLKYEDYRSCILAIDNLNGLELFDKKLKVDHVYFYLKDGQTEDDFLVDYSDYNRNTQKIEGPQQADAPEAKLKAEDAAQTSIVRESEFEDPMTGYLEKKNKRSIETKITDSVEAEKLRKPKKIRSGTLKFKS